MGLFGPRKSEDEEGQMELVEHLAELRTRIFRALLFVLVGGFVGWFIYPWVFEFILAPIKPILEKIDGSAIRYNSIQDAFLLQLQTSVIVGVILAAPFIINELWGFIRPALTPEERKPVRFLAPLAALLFVAGLTTAYAAAPTAYNWMASYIINIPDALLFQDAKSYLLLTTKIMLAFGIAFELPVVLLFLAKIGILTGHIMTTYWRHAVVVIAALAAIFAPSNEPITMMLMAIPMVGLYLASIAMVRSMEPNPDGTPRSPFWGMLLIYLAPALILAGASWYLWKTHPKSVAPVGTHETIKAHTPVEKALVQRIEALEKRLADLESKQEKKP
ncbi:MAG: twin-arginine translocase subunit TatC [Armatimonas sp.]